MLGLLRECAHAPAPRPQENLPIDYYYNMALKKLTSSVWTKHEQVRSWLNNYWLNISEVSLHSSVHIAYYASHALHMSLCNVLLFTLFVFVLF